MVNILKMVIFHIYNFGFIFCTPLTFRLILFFLSTSSKEPASKKTRFYIVSWPKMQKQLCLCCRLLQVQIRQARQHLTKNKKRRCQMQMKSESIKHYWTMVSFLRKNLMLKNVNCSVCNFNFQKRTVMLNEEKVSSFYQLNI